MNRTLQTAALGALLVGCQPKLGVDSLATAQARPVAALDGERRSSNPWHVVSPGG